MISIDCEAAERGPERTPAFVGSPPVAAPTVDALPSRRSLLNPRSTHSAKLLGWMGRALLPGLAMWIVAVGGGGDAMAAFNAKPIDLRGVPTLVYGNRVEISGEAQTTCVILIAIRAQDGANEEAYLAIPKQAASEIARFICKQSYPALQLEDAEIRCALAIQRLSPADVQEMVAPLRYRGNMQFYVKSLKFGLARLVQMVGDEAKDPVTLFCRRNDQGINMLVGFAIAGHTYDLTVDN